MEDLFSTCSEPEIELCEIRRENAVRMNNHRFDRCLTCSAYELAKENAIKLQAEAEAKYWEDQGRTIRMCDMCHKFYHTHICDRRFCSAECQERAKTDLLARLSEPMKLILFERKFGKLVSLKQAQNETKYAYSTSFRQAIYRFGMNLYMLDRGCYFILRKDLNELKDRKNA